MSFFDISKYRNDADATRELVEERERLKEELERQKWRERSAEYEREQRHYREQERMERQRENDMEYRANLQSHVGVLVAEMEDLRLRRKFGIEVIEE